MANQIKKNHVRIIFSVLLTIVIFLILFKNMDAGKVLGSIENANIRIIFFALVLSIINGYFISAYRWKLILETLGCPDISYKETIFIKMASDPIIGVFPLKSGEATRVLYLNRNKNFPHSKTIFSIFLEYIFNIFTVFFLIFIGLILGLFQTKGYLFPDFAFLSFCSRQNKFIFSKNERMKKVKDSLRKCYDCRAIIYNKKIIFLSLLYGFIQILCVSLLSSSVNIHIPAYALLIYIPIILAASSLPISFLGLGVREGLSVFFFKTFAPAQKLFALGLLFSFIDHIIPIIFCLIFTSVYINHIFWPKNKSATGRNATLKG